jgi:glutathione S-transferase
MITVHHLNNSRSQRVLWLLEELELAYEIVGHQRDAVTNLAPASLEAIHPLGHDRLMIGCDNNLPNTGRNPNLADDNEFIVIDVPGLD